MSILQMGGDSDSICFIVLHSTFSKLETIKNKNYDVYKNYKKMFAIFFDFDFLQLFFICFKRLFDIYYKIR